MNEPGDKSNGYDALADRYWSDEGPVVGRDVILRWSESLPAGAAVLELGCGPGGRVSQPLSERGFQMFGVDASPRMVSMYREHVPGAKVECADVMESDFFGRTFDAAVAWGLLFLMREDEQARLLQKVGAALGTGGRFLVTAPWQTGRWNDAMTGRESISLGRETYLRLLWESGFELESEASDEGENHYYLTRKV